MSFDPYRDDGHAPNVNKTDQVRDQVNEVVGIMRENVDKAMQRGENMEALQGKTEDLQQQAGHFRRGANQVRKRMWWKDLKWKIIIGVTIVVILAIIIGSVVGTQKSNSGSSSSSSNTSSGTTTSSENTGSSGSGTTANTGTNGSTGSTS